MAYNYGFSPYNSANNYDRFKRNQFASYQGTYNSYRPNYRSAYRVTGNNGQKPRSGCRVVAGKKDTSAVYVIGWKVGRSGFRKFIASPPKGGAKRYTSPKGIKWASCSVTIENVSAMTKTSFAGWIDETTKRVFVRSLNLLMNPQTGRITQFQKKK